MRKKSTRLLSAALAVCMMLSVLPVGAFAAEPGAAEPENGASAQAEEEFVQPESVEINSTNFQDTDFQNYVKRYDKDENDSLSLEERNKVTTIELPDGSNCPTMKGIEYFPELVTLKCPEAHVRSLDVSKNDKLTSLDCRRCGLTSLKFGSAVSSMECDENQLTVLDISQNTKWTDLRCGDNKLTSLSFNENVVMPLVASIYTSNNLYQIAVDADGIYDLSQLPGNFDVSKTSDWTNGERNGTELKVTPGSTTVTYKYNTGSAPHTGRRPFNLDVHWHKYQWQHDDTKHWRECTTANCPGLTAEQVAKTTHDYTDATDPDCNTCGYVRSMYTVTTGENVTAELEDKVLDAPVAADTKVHLTATVPEGQHFIGWTVKVGDEEQKADTFLTPDKNDPTKATFTMPSKNVEVTANFASNPTLNPTLRVGDHVTATIEGSDASVPSGSTVPVPKNKIVHLTANVPDGQHFISWTVLVGGEEQKADTFLKTPDADDPTKVTFTMPDKNVEVKATFAEDPIPEPDPVGPSDTGNIQGALSAVVVGAAAGAIIYEAGTGIYRVINMPGIPMPSNRIELAELLWEHAGKPEPVSTALYSDIDEGDTDAQKAARWAVEQDLMKDDADNNKFHPAFPVSKLRTCLTWNAAKEKGLFDKTEE